MSYYNNDNHSNYMNPIYVKKKNNYQKYHPKTYQNYNNSYPVAYDNGYEGSSFAGGLLLGVGLAIGGLYLLTKLV